MINHLLPNDPQRGRKQCVKVWRNFVQSYTAEVCNVAGPVKAKVSLWSQKDPLHLLKPSNNPDLYVNTKQLRICTSLIIWFDTACFCLSLTLESTVGWISTLAYETSTNCWPESFSVAYCTQKVQTKLLLKNQAISTKIYVYSYRIAQRHAGVLCRGWWAVTCNTQPSIYLNRRGNPWRAGILYSSFRSVLLSL